MRAGVPAAVVAASLSLLVAQTERAAAQAGDPPPAALPDGARFGSYGISFGSYGISFGSYGIGFGSYGITDEIRALAPEVVTASEAEPGPGPEALAEGLEVTEEGDGVRYTLSADILFDFDAATLRPEAREALSVLSDDVRQRFSSATLRVEGHTDSKGSDAYNEALSVRRAESVELYLTREEGFAAEGIEVVGLGESRPAAPNETPEGDDDPDGRQQNRRVEIVVRGLATEGEADRAILPGPPTSSGGDLGADVAGTGG